jgi:methionine-rich copper-binding protein CopC
MHRAALRSFLRRFALSALAGLVLSGGLAPAWPASAHAIIVEAVPNLDAVVKGPSVQVRLRFNSRIDHARSRLTLIDAAGKETVVALTKDAAPDMLSAGIADVPPGAYRLRWQVLAIDGHITRGDIPFTVSAP